MTKDVAKHSEDSGEIVAAALLGWLAQDADRLLPFLEASGLAPGEVRQAARDPGFLAAVLDHVMGDEPTLLAAAEGLDMKPEQIASAWHKLRPPDFDHTL